MYTEHTGGAAGSAQDALPADRFVACARTGDALARQQLCARTLPALRRWAARFRHAGHDADDLVQTAYLRALSRLGDFEVRGDGSFAAYLRQILLNEIRAELRRQQRRGDTVEVDDTLASHGDPVVEHALACERASAFRRALRNLSRRQREHIALRMHAGLSFGEIAARTGGNADGARMIVTRALRALAQQLAAA
jgi:RNA polymerase sigma-70 factor (ECF subfamily)